MDLFSNDRSRYRGGEVVVVGGGEREVKCAK